MEKGIEQLADCGQLNTVGECGFFGGGQLGIVTKYISNEKGLQVLKKEMNNIFV